MRLFNEVAATAFRVLDKCSGELEPDGPWRWQCAVENGTRLPIAASLDDGFLRLVCRPDGIRWHRAGLERALLRNSTLGGSVKIAFDTAGRSFNLTTDIVVLEEKQLVDRFRLAIDGFHSGHHLLRLPAPRQSCPTPEDPAGNRLGELLRGASWPVTERGPNEYSVELDAASAPPARIRLSECGVLVGVELARAGEAAKASRRALALFLLTTSSALRLVRSYAEAVEGGFVYGMQVNLPAEPEAEEIDHALAALSVAYRACALEADVLLNEATARCYLAARDPSTTNNHQSEEEN
jgi:hypothetical protein